MSTTIVSRLRTRGMITASISALAIASSASAATPEQIIDALRIANTITGGTMPTNDLTGEFGQMVREIESNDYEGAALIAAQSKYAAEYLYRRIALQLQNEESKATINDNNASAFVLAHLIGAGGVGAPSISKLWSSNFSCQVRNIAGTVVSARQLSAADKADMNFDWRTALVCTAGQSATGGVAIPLKHVGGYTTVGGTVQNQGMDDSFASNSLQAGTNLRFMKNYWEIATGMKITEFASSQAPVQMVPRFVPSTDPNFLVGQGQAACISCHAGGLTSLAHGYRTVADTYDYDNNGIIYRAAPATNQRKSLGSDAGLRNRILNCAVNDYGICNPDSTTNDTIQSWDLGTYWGPRGLLAKLGWTGNTAGQGLNELGAALGRSTIVHSNMVKRVIKEICPRGGISAQDHAAITQISFASDDIRQVVAKVAVNAACR